MLYSLLMDPNDEKAIKDLAEAVQSAKESGFRTFGRGFLFGLGRGIGSLIGWLILIAIIFYLLQVSGIADAFRDLTNAFGEVNDQIQNIPGVRK